MKSEIITAILTAVITAIGSGVLAALGYVGVKIKGIVEDKYNIHVKRETVETCVKAVEQLYHDLKGSEKLERCKKNVIDMLNEKGINITELELDMFIEAAVAQLNYKRLWGENNDDAQ